MEFVIDKSPLVLIFTKCGLLSRCLYNNVNWGGLVTKGLLQLGKHGIKSSMWCLLQMFCSKLK